VARPLTEDLQQIADTAERVGHGDLGARTGVTRPDEVGSVADALDIATARLAEVEEARGREHEARQAFLTAIGHDLRTPLSALRAAVEALQDGVASDLDRYLRAMHADVEVLTSLVDDLFLLARIEAGHLDLELTTVDLSELADEAIEAIRPVADRSGVTVHLETEGRVRALGGAGALSRVIRNLIDNAIQHSPPNGTVAVRVEGDGGALVRVTDSGPGFDADLVDRAFESFTRGDRARTRSTGGAGLGLAIARGFVEAHGGTIWADPGPGGQVAFWIPAPTGRPAS
jgi:signal transduction histidine kinase